MTQVIKMTMLVSCLKHLSGPGFQWKAQSPLVLQDHLPVPVLLLLSNAPHPSDSEAHIAYQV